MRRANRLVLSLVSVAVLSACQAQDVLDESLRTVAERWTAPPTVGAYASGVYRNLFKEWDPTLTDADIQAKVDQLYSHYFTLGGENTVYYAGSSNSNGPTAYILDTGNNDVRTEGMSYAMMIAVQLDRKADFDALWNWAKTYMQHNDGGVWDGYFAWHCSTRGRQLDKAPASDGEEYFATALLFAAHRWGNDTQPAGYPDATLYDYEAEANRILNTMLHKQDMNGGIVSGVTNMFDAVAKEVVFVPYYGSATHTDPSYHLPAFYELWGRWAQGYDGQQAADRQFWLDAAAKSRLFFGWTTNPTTALNPDYAEFDGTPKADAAGDSQGLHADFRYDAWRTAVNWSVDYAWWAADANEVTFTDRLQSFFYGQGLSTYGNLYELDGSALSTTHSLGLVASNGAASLAATNVYASDFVGALWNAAPAIGQYRYYDGLLHMLATLHASGNFRIWGEAPDPCAPLVTCSDVCVDLETNPSNCGSCGNQCAAGAACTAGECVVSCDPGLESCSGVCVDLETDPSNCGSCGKVCPMDSTCSAGACQCDAGLERCSDICADLQIDPDHCGTCGNVCATGLCEAGVCQGGAGVYQMQNAEVVMEAEHFITQVSNGSLDVWTLTADGAASGGERIDLLPNDGTIWSSNVEMTSPRVDYLVNFTSTGTFKFYIRAAGATRNDDACWGGIDNSHIAQAFAPNSKGVLTWGYRNVTVASPGVHTVSLWGFEDGMRVDKIVITQGSAPTGTGAAESPQQ